MNISKDRIEQITSPALPLSFTANHAHLVPEGVDGFLAQVPLDRVARTCSWRAIT